MKGYRFLLADADNTLFDFSAGERLALRQTFRAFSLPEDDAALAAYLRINEALWKALERGETDSERLRVQRFELLLGELGLSRDANALSTHYLDALGRHPILLPGAREAMARWAKRVPVAIVTNGIAHAQRARVARSPIHAYARALIISEEVGAAKPDPRIVHAALSALECDDRSRALLLGDSLRADIAAAANASIASCWFNPAGAEAPDDIRPTHIVASLDEVDALLMQAVS